eukprot:905540-Pyramimonas_sp.AAC.1
MVTDVAKPALLGSTPNHHLLWRAAVVVETEKLQARGSIYLQTCGHTHRPCICPGCKEAASARTSQAAPARDPH